METDAPLRPTWRERLELAAVGPRDVVLWLVCRRYRNFVWAFERLHPRYLAWSSRVRARRAFYRAARDVPAYTRFLALHGATRSSTPETDKASYINAFPPESRCVRGHFPPTRTMIDESSGSTGTPYNWIRSEGERRDSHLFISYFATYCYGEQPWITINAFSMGAWATGLNMGIALQKNSIVKNTGPDLDKIISTLRFLGPRYPYLILGYPPFLKQLVDVAVKRDFPLKEYKISALVGGEGMSEGLRDYLLRHLQRVYSGYGATDLEIGIAGETPISLAIRRLARDNSDVRARLFGNDSRLPMLFQYNPLMHHVEINDNREVIFTITRGNLLSPRIRYNVHDEGGVMRYDQMARALAEAGYGIDRLIANPERPVLRLPFLWIYGRRDFTISIMGANIYPEDLEQCVYADPELARITRSFCQSLTETPDGGVRPAFHFEVEADVSEALRSRFAESVLRTLVGLNADFRAAWHECPQTLIPDIQLYGIGQGPFHADAGKIKQARLLKTQDTSG